jgi:phage terminase Nu1 subunit (DNA packaging protein)
MDPVEGEIPVTLERAADLCGVTEKTIRSWIEAGLPVLQQGKQGRGAVKTLVDLAQIVRWITEAENALDAARTRLAEAQSEKHEMENAVRRKELADVKDVDRVWSDLVLATRAKFLSMPAKLAAQLTNLSDAAVVATRIRTEIYAALAELGTAKPRSGRSQVVGARRSKQVSATAGTDGQPVGRRKSKVKQRSLS